MKNTTITHKTQGQKVMKKINPAKPIIKKCFGIAATDLEGREYILIGGIEPRTKSMVPLKMELFEDGRELTYSESLIGTYNTKREAQHQLPKVKALIDKPYVFKVVMLQITMYPSTIEIVG